jgi:hypothetical protein
VTSRVQFKGGGGVLYSGEEERVREVKEGESKNEDENRLPPFLNSTRCKSRTSLRSLVAVLHRRHYSARYTFLTTGEREDDLAGIGAFPAGCRAGRKGRRSGNDGGTMTERQRIYVGICECE